VYNKGNGIVWVNHGRSAYRELYRRLRSQVASVSGNFTVGCIAITGAGRSRHSSVYMVMAIV